MYAITTAVGYFT